MKRVRAFVAAARRVDVSTSTAVKATISKRAGWQDDVWAFYDEVPEVKFALNFLSNGMQKVRFFAAARNLDGQLVPIDAEDSPLVGQPIAAQAMVEMDRVRNGVSGQGEINRLLTLNLEAPGECHLHGMAAIEQQGQPGEEDFVAGRLESWDVRSISEVEFTDTQVIDATTGQARPKIVIKKNPDDKGREYDPETETLIRFWQRHPRFSDWADSLLRSCLSDCEMLTLLMGEAKAISKSRHNAGAFTLPAELSFVDDDTEGSEDEDDEEAQANPFITAFMKHMAEPVTDPSSPASVQRLVISGPAEFLKPDVLRAIDLSRPADDKLTEKWDRHINRLARGLNVPVEVVMGHMSTTFSNAEQIDQDTFDDFFEPRCTSIADGYAVGFLRPQLLEAGYNVETVAMVEVGYDAAALVRDQSLDDKADTLLEHGAISMAAYRRLRGIGEGDAPDEAERLRNLAERKGILTAEVFQALMRAAGVDLQVEALPTAAAPAEDAPIDTVEATPPEDDTEAVAAAVRNPLANLGRQLAAIDRSLRLRLAGAADMAMMRALERAGAKLSTSRTAAVRNASRSLAKHQVAAHLGPALVAEAGFTPDDLLDGAWDDLGRSFKTWAGEASEQAIETVMRALGGKFSRSEIADLKLRTAGNIDEAWTWLDSSLSDLGKKALFSPDLEPGDIGEIESLSHIPAGTIREALMRAGGATGFRSNNGVVTPTNKIPLGGVATGEAMTGVLANNGAYTNGFVWVYGPARRRSFEPHLMLDGREFENFDDPRLANDYGWPETSHYYPGDHNGCVCDFEPIIGPPMRELVQGVEGQTIPEPPPEPEAPFDVVNELDALNARIKPTMSKMEVGAVMDDLEGILTKAAGRRVEIRGHEKLNPFSAMAFNDAMKQALKARPEMAPLLHDIEFKDNYKLGLMTWTGPGPQRLTVDTARLAEWSGMTPRYAKIGHWTAREPGDLIVHEMMHGVDFTYNDMSAGFLTRIEKITQDNFGVNPGAWYRPGAYSVGRVSNEQAARAREWIQKHVSNYGTSNKQEFIAELIGAVRYDPEMARLYGREVQKHIDGAVAVRRAQR